MGRQRAISVVAAVALMGGAAVFSSAGTAGAAGSTTGTTTAAAHSESPVCGTPANGSVRCYAHILHLGDGVRSDTATGPTGLSPATIKSVYGFSPLSNAGAGQTIAIVDAYDDPTVFADFNTFNAQY